MPCVESADSCDNNVESGAKDDDDISFDNGDEVDDPGVNDDDDDAGDSGDDSDDSGVNDASYCLWQSVMSLLLMMTITGIDDDNY